MASYGVEDMKSILVTEGAFARLTASVTDRSHLHFRPPGEFTEPQARCGGAVLSGVYFAWVVKPSKVGFTTHRCSKSQVKLVLLPEVLLNTVMMMICT